MFTRPGVARQPVPSTYVASGRPRGAGPAPTAVIRLPSTTTWPTACSVRSASMVTTAQPSITIGHRSPPGGQAHGLDDLLVARAAAQVAGQRLADLGVVRVGVAGQQVVGRDQQPGRAEAALHRAGVDERLLHRVQLAARRRSPSTVTTSRPSAWPAAHQAGAAP